jgi:hypothetical protein
MAFLSFRRIERKALNSVLIVIGYLLLEFEDKYLPSFGLSND